MERSYKAGKRGGMKGGGGWRGVELWWWCQLVVVVKSRYFHGNCTKNSRARFIRGEVPGTEQAPYTSVIDMGRGYLHMTDGKNGE